MSAGMLGVPIHFIPVGWTAHSRPTYTRLARLECAYILSLLAGSLLAAPHICQLACLECAYILSLLAGPLVAGPHICQLEHLKRPYILGLLAGPLLAGPHICRLACLGHPYILSLLAGPLLVGLPYMLPSMHGAHMIISGPKCYMQLQDIISAEIGWNAICRHLTHMKICL